MTDLGSVSHYLGISITQTRDFVSLNQKSFLDRVLLQFGMDIYKPASSPIDSEVLNSILPASENEQVNKDTIFWYGAVVGWLIYTMTMTRLGLEYALSMIAQYCTNPNSSQIVAVVQILRSVRSTLHYGLTYTKGQLGSKSYTNID